MVHSGRTQVSTRTREHAMLSRMRRELRDLRSQVNLYGQHIDVLYDELASTRRETSRLAREGFHDDD